MDGIPAPPPGWKPGDPLHLGAPKPKDGAEGAKASDGKKQAAATTHVVQRLQHELSWKGRELEAERSKVCQLWYCSPVLHRIAAALPHAAAGGGASGDAA